MYHPASLQETSLILLKITIHSLSIFLKHSIYFSSSLQNLQILQDWQLLDGNANTPGSEYHATFSKDLALTFGETTNANKRKQNDLFYLADIFIH